MKFGEKIKELENLYSQRDLTQDDLADALGISVTTLQRWKAREDSPNVDSARRAGLLLGSARRAVATYQPEPKFAQSEIRSMVGAYRERGFTHNEIAFAMNISASTLSNLMRGGVVTELTKAKLGLIKREGELKSTLAGSRKIADKLYDERGDLVRDWNPETPGLLFGSGYGEGDEESANIRERANLDLLELVESEAPIKVNLEFMTPDGIIIEKQVVVSGYKNLEEFWKTLYTVARDYMKGDAGSDFSISVS